MHAPVLPPQIPIVHTICGDALQTLRRMNDCSINCVVTSPPYFGLRDYGTAKWEGGEALYCCEPCGVVKRISELTSGCPQCGQTMVPVECDHKQGRPGAGRADGIVDDRAQRNRDGVGSMGGDCKKCGAVRIDDQIGLEQTPTEYVAKLVEIFREARRVLRDDGTLWLNLGDSYASAWVCNRRSVVGAGSLPDGRRANRPNRLVDGLKEKDLMGIPWRVAFALQADGWYLRQDIIWAKPNPMPESVRDRCTKSHEYIFMLSKSEKYFYDCDAVKEPAVKGYAGSKFESGKTAEHQLGRASKKPRVGNKQDGVGKRQYSGFNARYDDSNPPEFRNRRSVWTISTKPYKEAHFATFPPDLVEPCIKAGCPPNGIVLDPFGGAGTTGLVAKSLNRNAILIELNPAYVELINKRLA